MREIYNKEAYKAKLMTLLPEADFEILTFMGTENPCEIKCNKCGKSYFYKIAASFAKRAKRGNKDICPNCEKSDRKTIQEYRNQCLLQSSIRPLEKKLEDIRWSSKTPEKWICQKCGNTFEKRPFNFFQTKEGLKCPWCEATFAYYTDEMIDFKIEQTWGDEYSRVGETTKNDKGQRRLKVRHNTCGFIWEVDFCHFIHDQTGCPRCRASHGERKVRSYLQKYNIAFKEQKAIFIDGHTLRFDFYMEINNKKYAIEYNGIQHYKPVERFGGQQAYDKQKNCDELKKKYCQENNIILIIIPYNDESLLKTDLLAQRLNEQVL